MATHKSDKELVETAVENKDYWEIIYRAKRILQVDDQNQQAQNALLRVPGGGLLHVNDRGVEEVHPLFGTCDGNTIRDIVIEADLVEREGGSDICEINDRTESVFIVLKGEVAFWLPEGRLDERTLVQKNYPGGRGQIFGEMAHALHRARSATVRTTTMSALLALKPSLIRDLQKRPHVGPNLIGAWRTFILSRILNAVFRGVSYFGVPGESGPLKSVALGAEKLKEGTVIHEFDWHSANDRIIQGTGERFKRRGLYLLSGGRLTNEDNDNHVLDGERGVLDVNRGGYDQKSFPIVAADFGTEFVHNFRRLTLKPGERAKIMFISQEILSRLDAEVFQGLLHGIMHDALRVFYYDVFLSYSSIDDDEALQWENELLRAGLKVYRDIKTHPDHFHYRVFSAILDSVIFVPLLSKNTCGQNSWVAKEVRCRQAIYPRPGGITPVIVTGGSVQAFLHGYSPIDGTNREQAVAKLIDAVHRARKGLPSILRSRRRVSFQEIEKVAYTVVPEA